jgi:IMP dehydrogenase
MKKQKTVSDLILHKIVPHEALTFDDILLLPGYADFKRRDVDLSTQICRGICLKLPIISSPMDTVTEEAMAIALARAGALGVIHRNLPVSSQARMVAKVKNLSLLVAAAVGVGMDFDERVSALVTAGADLVVVDSGHGYTKCIIDTVKTIKKRYPQIPVMAGNIATFDAAKALIGAGTDILRVGMGPGSICTTRIVTGMGVPQISAISAVKRATEGTSVSVIADGGIRQMGDMAKAFAFGACAVMLGSLLARFTESPGKIIRLRGKLYKEYRGMGSIAAMKKGGAERYGQSHLADTKQLIAEGVEGRVPLAGTAAEYLTQVAGSLRSSFYYIGARNLPEFFQKSRCIKISNAGLLESHPHSVDIVDTGTNYSR